MLRRQITFIPLYILALGAAFVAFRAVEPDFYLGGIQVNEPDHQAWVRALDKAGLNTVAVTIYAHQGDWDTANLWFDDDAPWVVNEIRVAKKRGLRVVLVLRVALDHAFERNRFFWHGMIMPETDAMVEEWFERYGRFVDQWARVAENEGIDVLAVASEMNALTNTVPVVEVPSLEEYWSNEEKVEREQGRLLEHAEVIESRHLELRGGAGYEALEPYLLDEASAHRAWARRLARLDEEDPVAAINRRRELLEQRWIDLIEHTRSLYTGTLTYAANFDQYESVGFWNRLDLIGVNAYFPLRRRLLPGSDERDLAAHLTAGWTRELSRLDAFRGARGLERYRVLFTEIGYVRRANSTIEPWAARGFSVLRAGAGGDLMIWEDQEPDERERALAVRALYDAHLALGGEMLAGLLYWKLSTVDSHRTIEPFVLLLGEPRSDPLLGELRRFTRDLRMDRLRHALALRLGFGAGPDTASGLAGSGMPPPDHPPG
jgi:hypothetical protein